MNIFNKTWWKKAGTRALKTMAEVALSFMTIGMALKDIDWKGMVSVSVAAGIYSLLINIKGIPEMKE